MIRRRIKKGISTAKARVSTATRKGRNTVGRLITSAKQPATRLGNTIGRSTKLGQHFSRKAVPKIRMGKILGNVPAIFSKWKRPTFKVPKLPSFKFPKLPKIQVPRILDPRRLLTGLGMYKADVTKIKFPDFPGFLKDKAGDIAGSFEGLVEKTMGAAGDWNETRKRKKLIFKIVVGIILVFLGILLWKKK